MVVASAVAIIIGLPLALVPQPAGADEPPQTPVVCLESGEVHTFAPFLTTFVIAGVGFETVMVVENTGSDPAIVEVVMDDFSASETLLPTTAVTLQTLVGTGESKEFELQEFLGPDVRVGTSTVQADQPFCAYLRFERSILVTLDSLHYDLTRDIDEGVLPRGARPLPEFISIADRHVLKGNFQQAMSMLGLFERHTQKLIASQQVSPNVGVPYLERVGAVMDMLAAAQVITP